MPSTTTEELLAELQLTHETTMAVADLFTAVAGHSTAVAVATENAIETEDLAVIQEISRLLDLMTETIQKLEQPSPPTRPRLV